MNNKPYSSQSILNSIYDPETQSLRITRDMPNGDYAPKEHTHVIGDVINLQNELDSKADVDHNHDEQYLSLSGGSMTGTLHADSPVFTGDISEGGMLLSEKYAAKEHSHNEKADKASTLAGYGIMDAYTKSETDAKISSVYRYRGSVETYADLPTEGQKEGDVWNIASADAAHGINAGDNVAWTADGEWDALSGQVDLTPFALKTDAATDHDHDGTYIKTSGETIVPAHGFAIKAPYSDSTASTRTGYLLYKNGNTIQIGGNGNCDRITLSTAGFSLDFYNYDKSIIVKDTSVNKTYFSFKGGDLNVSSSLSEAGTKLSDKYATITHRHDDDYAAIDHDHNGTYLPIAGGTISGNLQVGDNNGNYIRLTNHGSIDTSRTTANAFNSIALGNAVNITAGSCWGFGYQINVTSSGGNCMLVGRGHKLANLTHWEETYLGWFSQEKTDSFLVVGIGSGESDRKNGLEARKNGDLFVAGEIYEGDTKLTDKYAAKSHTHEIADVSGLQGALDSKVDINAVHSYAVTYAETLPMATENAPGCVIVTGATSETQTRGHVYALTNVEHSLATSLNVSFENDVYSADTFRVYGSGSNYGSGGTLYEFDLAWISNASASGTNVGQLILFKRKGSDTRWYLMGTSTGEYWGCEDNRCLDIDDPTELSGMVFRNLDEGSATNISVGSTMSLSVTDAGAGGSIIDFTYGDTVVPMYQVADYNGKPKWLGKSTEGGMATQSLYFDGAPGWRYRNTSDHSPANLTWNGQVENLIGTSGMEWSDSEHGMGYAVTVTEKQLPSVTSHSYEDITVTELESLRASLSALEARVAALEV